MFSFHARHAAIALAGLLLAGGFLLMRESAGGLTNAGASPSAPAIPVDVATIRYQAITDWHEYSGRLEAVDRVEIRPLVSGTLTQVHFKDGALVRQGDPLFTIDPRPYQAAVDEAQAQLAAATARVAYTDADLARARRLLAGNAIARRDFEEKRNAAREASARVQAAQAALQSARLDLEHTRIVAPISGRVSKADATAGNVVSVGGARPLTTMVSVSQLYASFEMDEQAFLQMNSAASAGAPASIPVSMGLANEQGYPRRGKLAFLDNSLDPQTGTIRVRALFDNPDGRLRPGLYAKVRLGSGAAHDAVLLQEKAIGTDQAKRFVMVVDAANKAAYREVTLGSGREGWRIVQTGLKAGDRVVVNGMQRLRPGDTVAPTPVQANDGALATRDTDTPSGSEPDRKQQS
ncbi:efflux RND transporter periplasmic adaptor subunit [Castellaniella sp.]|uniref:efflux RND transporter periplasmic adaptor subunit n=1 Tax=Castellaniella sp. TaxID=1955812 RepID=UPI002AFE8FC0|nr:efflux RND transporter periplasmic adaptor subunit [Castellaniella sp.]